MAMNYQNFASLGVNLNRQKYGPLDISNVFTSVADLKYYLTKGEYTEGVSEYWYKNANDKVVPYPYEGQVLATVIDGAVSVFALSLDAEGKFQTQEIGAKVEVDGTTIVKDAEGKLSIIAPVNPDSAKSYNFSYANGKYSWVEVDTATAAGQAQAIASLEGRATALKTGVDENAQAIANETSARKAAIGAPAGEGTEASGVYASIAEALQTAKDYADENDANTIYNDTELKSRVEAIESDYLKAADKYNDTVLVGRVAAIEGDYLKTADKYDDTDVKARIKALEDEERYDDTELSGRVQTLESASNDHATRIAAMESFWDATEDSDGIVNKLKEIQDYIASDETGAAAMAGDIKANADAIKVLNGDAEGSVNKKIADAIAPLATTQALNEVRATAEAAQTADQVTSAIEDALEAAQYAKDAEVVKSTDFETFKTDNTTAIATAKQEAIDAAKAAEEAKGYAVAETVANTYATKAALSAHEEEITNELLAYAKTETVNAAISEINSNKANAADVYTKTDADAKFQTEAQVDARISTLIDAANSEDTIKNVADLVKYVNDNASDIAELVTNVNTNKGDIETIKAWKDAAVLPKASAEVTVADDGTLGLREVSVNKLVQATGDILVLNGGSATTVI